MSGEGVEFPRRQLLLVGDRVLITPEEGDDRTRVGLYLPATAVDTPVSYTHLTLPTN